MDDGNPYYIVLDEVQLVEEFVEVILSLTHMRNVDVYVSGSNSRFLSSDVVTEFRGRGDEIRIWPLTFDEYFSGIGGDIRKAWLDYYTFGGLPQVALLETEEKKTDYLRGLYETTCIVNVVLLHYKRNPFATKRSLFSPTFVIFFGIHLHNPLNINDISKIAQNYHLNAPKIS